MSLSIPTADELYALYKAEVLARNPGLTDWESGSVLDALDGASVIVGDQVIRIVIDQAKARYIATAVGSDLDAAVTDLYPSLTRKAASGAVGTLAFARGTNTAGITVPAGTLASATVAGVTLTYATDEELAIPAGVVTDEGGSVTATCTLTGAAGNANSGVITTIVSTIADDITGDMTVTNTGRFVGGSDAESDDAYRARAQAYPSTLALGTVDAIQLAAIGVPGIFTASVDESSLPDVVYVYIADADGYSNAAQVTAAQTAVDAVRAAGVLVTVLAASRNTAVIALTVYVRTGKGTAALSAAISAAVVAYGASLPPNSPIYLSKVQAAAVDVDTANIVGAVATCDTAVGDTVSASSTSNTIRIDATDLTITFSEVA